jgi:hypothetical protein
MLQLQQLGLPLGFRSKVIWWNDYLKNHYHKTYETKYFRGNRKYERRYNRPLAKPHIFF